MELGAFGWAKAPWARQTPRTRIELAIHLANTFWNGIYPFVDYPNGGSINGQINAFRQQLTKAAFIFEREGALQHGRR
ncbi:hypothetical protein [Rhizobium tubonense]|uniref:hypothetical protein n=1 Tax=Rhizobium tubonense TaxID=484088 RepID=UPI0011B537B8|nr:hypothetical protein [Rhizobium tubonense]